MGKGFAQSSPARWLAALVAIGAMWVVAFQHDDRIPGLTWVNLGMHELGRMLTYASSELTHQLSGSIAQVAIPGLFALYFFFRRGDWVAAGFCLAWAASSAAEVAIYVADAPVQKLDRIGDTHDWAFILGPEGYSAMGKADSLAQTIRDWASVAIVAGFVMCLAAPLRGRRPQPEETAVTSRARAASS